MSLDFLSPAVKETFFLRAFSFLKIPLLGWVQPSILETTDKRMVLKIPLMRKTKNHLGVMYFGALSMGGEAAIGVRAAFAIQKSGKKVEFLFKDFKANFLKRADGDVHFICDQIDQVEALIQKAIDSGERENQTFKSYAVVPSKDPSAVIAEFEVTMTVKSREKVSAAKA